MKNLIFILFAAGALNLYAQDGQEKPTQPLELPRAVIVGKADLNVKSGVKQLPGKPLGLSGAELDSLNSFDKRMPPLLPMEPIAADALQKKSYLPGFISASYGRFNNFEALAGYKADFGLLDVYAEGGADIHGDFVPNSAYQKYGAKIRSSYIAPEKFYIFGGSNTRTNFNLNALNYKNYASISAYERSAYDFDGNISSEGSFEGFNFNMGAALGSLQMQSDSVNGFDNSINGFMNINKRVNNVRAGVELFLDLHSLRGSSVNFMQALGFASYDAKLFALRGKAGFQTSTNSSEINRSGFLLSGDILFRMNKMLTISGEISTGLNNTMFREYFYKNPYLKFDAPLDFSYDIMALKGLVHFHPFVNLNLAAGVNFSQTSRYPVFTPAGKDALFDIAYLDATILKLNFEGNVNLTDKDIIVFNAEYALGDLNDYEAKLPYLPDLRANIEYHRDWSENFGIFIAAVYVGERIGSLDGKVIVPDYFLVNAGAEYKIIKNLKAFVNLENLLNSNIYIWNGYKERDLFLSLGLTYQF